MNDPAVGGVRGDGTAAAFMVVVGKAGPGFLMYLAMLGGAAGWLLPGLLAQASPLGLFGGALLASAESRRHDPVRPRDVLNLTVLVTLLNLGIAGWLLPEAHRATAAASARFQNQGADMERQEPPSPALLDLPQLLGDRSERARAELWRRLLPVAGCFLSGLAATGMIAAGWRLSTRLGMMLTSALYILQMGTWNP